MSLWSTVVGMFFCLAAACSQGCAVRGRDPSLVWHVDKSFSEADRNCMESAADTWQSQTSGMVNFGFEYDIDRNSLTDSIKHQVNHRIVKSFQTDQDVLDRDKRSQQLHGNPNFQVGGWTNGVDITQNFAQTIEIKLVDERFNSSDTHCQRVVFHEFGHALGINHEDVPDSHSIMAAVMDNRNTPCAKRYDLAALCKHNDCLGFQMKPCPEVIW